MYSKACVLRSHLTLGPRNCFGNYPLWADFVNTKVTICENQVLSNTHTYTPPPHTHTDTHTPCITHRYEVLTHERGRK